MQSKREAKELCEKCKEISCLCALHAFFELVTEEKTEYVEDRLTGTLYEFKYKTLKEDIEKP